LVTFQSPRLRCGTALTTVDAPIGSRRAKSLLWRGHDGLPQALTVGRTAQQFATDRP